MAVNVQAVLSQLDSEQASLPVSHVEHGPLEPLVDPGHLLISDPNSLETDFQLDVMARNSAQLLMNRIFGLPIVRVEDVTCVELPAPDTVLPREKPLPELKAMTKWEKYAKEKGIEKKKKTNVIWDDVVKEWVPRFGYKKAKAEETKNWMMPYKGNAPDDEDPFEKAIESKRERVAKNEVQRLRNIARAKSVKIPKVGVTPMVAKQSNTSTDLKKAAALAQKSTASVGKFQPKLSGALEKSVKPPRGKKRQFDPLVSSTEKEKNLKIFEQINKKAPKLDMNKAVGREMFREDQERKEEKQSGKKSGKGGRFSKKGGRANSKKAAGKGGKRR